MTVTTQSVVLYVGKTSDDGRHVLLRGDLRNWLGRNRIPALRTPTHRGWWLRSERLADVVALAESQGVRVKVRAS